MNEVEYARLKINGVYTDFLELFRVQQPVHGIDFFNTTLQPDRWHFCHFIHSKAYPQSTLDLAIELKTKTNVVTLELRSLTIREQPIEPAIVFPSARVGICMATYNPNIELFKKQIDSIRNQTESSWQLIINDDCSDIAKYKQIMDIVKNDDRIHVFRNENNIGFYYNFEKCLNRTHNQFPYIALADQDDFWFPEKLKTLCSEIGDNYLIFNDLEIRDSNDMVISNTFWNQRSNHFDYLPALFIANTVTGSASIFQSKLISRLIPFPARLGNAFHDHWMALAAAIEDRLTYHDEPLQYYVQHTQNVTGYDQFKAANMTHSTLSLLSLQRMKAVVALQIESKKNNEFIQDNLKVYFDAYLRRKLQYEILIGRMPNLRRNKIDSIFSGSRTTAINSLLKLHWKVYKKNWKTNNAELSYINALEVINQLRIKFNSKKVDK